MKSLIFETLLIHEFKDIRAPLTIDFKKIGKGAHFVAGDNQRAPRLGSNGSGKSSIWDALCWCLYGITPRGLRTPDIRPWHMEKAKPTVELFIKINGDGRIIKRQATTNGLWIDGKVVEQAKIDDLIGLNYDAFLQTILIAQKRELFLEMRPAEKLKLLSEVADFSRWDDYSAEARALVVTHDKVFDKLQADAANATTNYQETLDDLAGLVERSRAWEAEAAEEEGDRATKLAEARKAKKAAEKRKGDADLKLESAETEARATAKRLQIAREKRASLKEEGAALIVMVNGLAQQLREYEEEIEGVADGVCSKCGQNLKGTALAKHTREIKTSMAMLQKQAEESEKNAGLLEKAHKEAVAEVEKLLAEYEAFVATSDDARDNMTRASEDLAKADATINSLTGETKRADERANPYRALIKKARKRREEWSQIISNTDDLIAECERRKEHTKYWVQGFKNIRLYLLDEVLKELEETTQSLLPAIGLDDWIIEYRMEKETQSGKTTQGLDVRVISPENQKPGKFDNWSGGEGQRLLIIGQVALSEVLLRHAGITCDLLILDEPTRHMSPEGIDDVCDFLAERGHDAQVFYCDHQAVPSHLFASTLRMIKDKKGARLKIAGRGAA